MWGVAKYLIPLEVRAAILDPWRVKVHQAPAAYIGAPGKADAVQNENEMSLVRCLFAKQVPTVRLW